MNCLVLSGTAPVVPSGTRSSCYRGPESWIRRANSEACGSRNFSNQDSFGIFLTQAAFCLPAINRQHAAERVMIVALLIQKGASARQRSRCISPVNGSATACASGLRRGTQGSALDCRSNAHASACRASSARRLARDFAPSRSAGAGAGRDHIVFTDAPGGRMMRSALLAADLVLIPVQQSQFDGWASAEMLSLIGEARVTARARGPLRAQPMRRAHRHRPRDAQALADHDRRFHIHHRPARRVRGNGRGRTPSSQRSTKTARRRA